MTFISLSFLIFFIIVTLLYFAIPHKWRWLLLLIAGCIFYISFIPVYIFFLFLLIIVDFFAAILISRSKGKKRELFLLVSVASTLAALFVFKYYNFFIVNFDVIIRFFDWNYTPKLLKLALPIGLSFHTFQSLAYVIEVYRGKQKVERNFGIYALYVMFYPQLMAGPIERPGHMLPQLHKKHDFEYTRVIRGLRLMLWGAFEKVAIADQAAKVVNLVYGHLFSHAGLSLIVSTVMFAFQIFCDFDGYSNIAIGAARIMGFNLIKNFDRPYLASSIKEFWHRWHISLSTWFRDYVYIPLGGNRTSPFRHAINIMISFLLSGLWHGANWTFVVWGGLHGLYLVVGNFLSSASKVKSNLIGKLVSTFVTFVLVAFAWIFFRAENLSEAFYIVNHLFTNLPSDLSGIFTTSFSEVLVYFGTNDKFIGLNAMSWLFLIGSILLMLTIHKLQDSLSMQKLFERVPLPLRWVIYYAAVLTVLYYAAQGREQFLYFQF